MAVKRGLHISEDLTLPLDTVTSTMVVYGGKGMGKTNFGGVLVEELSAAGQRWSVLDPMGVWWGMRHSVDGKGKGVECLIMGGAHGDIPIEPTGGAVVADLVADERVNVIIDISRKANGEMWTLGERIRFVRDYGKQLFRRQGSLVDGKRREPICQVMDEAARFIPQMISSGEQDVAQCMGIWRAIVEEGRNVGIGVMLLTQRSARLNKDVAELADVMLAFRTVGPNSIKAVTDWLGAHVPKTELNDMVTKMRTLPVGSCLAVSPGWLEIEKVVRIRMRHTFDSSATPKAGESTVRVRGEGAKPDLQLYAQRMAATIERAKEDDPKALKERIRKLEAAAVKPATNAPPTAPNKGALPSQQLMSRNAELTEANAKYKVRVAGLIKKASQADRFVGQILTQFEQLSATLQKLKAGVAEIAAEEVPALSVALPPVPALVRQAPLPPAAPRPVTASKPVADDASGSDRKLTGNALKIAQIAAGYAERGEGIEKKLLAVLCGASMGGSFAARISEARTSGAIETEGSVVRATPEGIDRFGGQFQAPSTTEEVLALWRPKLTGTALMIFDHLVSLRGESISRADLATAVGASMGGSFAARLSEVRSTQLLKESGTLVAVNKDLLFM